MSDKCPNSEGWILTNQTMFIMDMYGDVAHGPIETTFWMCKECAEKLLEYTALIMPGLISRHPTEDNN